MVYLLCSQVYGYPLLLIFNLFVLSLYFSCFSVSCSWHAGLLIGSVNLAVFYFASLISLRKNASASEPDA